MTHERTPKQYRDDAAKLRAQHNHNAAGALEQRAREIGDLPERLFARSLEEMQGLSVSLFEDVQDAASMLAEIRNRATCEVCDTQAQCSLRAVRCYLSGVFLGETPK